MRRRVEINVPQGETVALTFKLKNGLPQCQTIYVSNRAEGVTIEDDRSTIARYPYTRSVKSK